MNTITFSRAAVRGARKVKAFVELAVIATVKTHGKLLDRRVAQAYDKSTRQFEQCAILQAAAVNMQDDAENSQTAAQIMENMVAYEKRSLGL